MQPAAEVETLKNAQDETVEKPTAIEAEAEQQEIEVQNTEGDKKVSEVVAEPSGVNDAVTASEVSENIAATEEADPELPEKLGEASEPVLETVAEEPKPARAKPKRRGWWSLGQ